MILLRLAALTALAALSALSPFASATSVARNPLKAIDLVRNPSVLTHNHRVTAVSTFDVAFDVSGARVRLSLEPNHDVFVDGATVQYVGADGRVARKEPLNRLAHKVYKGTAWLRSGSRWDNVGWARISIRRDGLDPLFEGVFTIRHDHHHVQLSHNYKKTRHDLDPDVDVRDHEYMVVSRDSDISTHPEHTELRKRSGYLGCPSDNLGFNMDMEHPVYSSMTPRDSPFLSSSPISSILGRRQNLDDNPPGGGNGAGVNLVSTIGNTAGCPSTRKVALVGVAADCNYRSKFADDDETRDNIIQQMNAASSLFESTFNISLGLANLIVTEAQCPTNVQQGTPWNQACGPSIKIQDRLNLFSEWRGSQDDEYSHWTLLTTCGTDSAVGLAWLGQACKTGSQPNQDGAETVAGANVVVQTPTEWQVIAHETGHTFGAVHDCTERSCNQPNVVNAQKCCPLSADTCDANEDFIMNPSTAQGITRFSACSIGNICSALGRNSVQSSCLTNNRGVVTVTGQTCGNGIVEGDEQCDCGGEEGCGSNQCCDPDTCKFRDNAVCDDSNEDCCRDCQFASASTVCRASSGDCDPEEKCPGTGPYCPEDKTTPDGTDCGNGLQCASGQCTSRDQQCKLMMGSYTQGNDTYACDRENCMLSCASPEFGRACYGLQQNFLDGTPCGAGGSCRNGQCSGSSIGNEVKDWIDRHKSLVIGLAAGIGSLIVLSILWCCWRSYRRRRRGKAYATNPTFRPDPAPASFIPLDGVAYGSRSRSGARRIHRSPAGSGGPLTGASPPPNQWQGNNVSQPPPMYQRSSSVRYA